MTNVHIYLKRGDGVSPSVGEVWLYPFKRLNAEGFFILPDPVIVELVDGQATIDMRPSGVDWAWYVDENVPAGIKRLVAVPDSVSTLQYDDLVDVDPATLSPIATPVAGWWAVANDNIVSANVSNGLLTFTQFDGGTVGPFSVVGPASTVPGPKGDPGDLNDRTSVNISGTTAIPASIPSTQVYTLTGNVTLSIATGQAGKSYSVTLKVVQDATGSRVVTWPSNVQWSEGVKPNVPSLPGAVGIYHMFWDGVVWFGFVAGQNFA